MNGTYTLYGSRGSGSAAVELAREACSLPYRQVHASTWIIDYPERWTLAGSEQARDDLRQGTRRQLHRHWEIFADTFAGTPFLSGARPGALDFLAAVVSKWSGTRAYLREHRPAFFATLEAIEAHESVAPVFKRHWDA